MARKEMGKSGKVLLSDTDPAVDRSTEYTEFRNAWWRMRGA